MRSVEHVHRVRDVSVWTTGEHIKKKSTECKLQQKQCDKLIMQQCNDVAVLCIQDVNLPVWYCTRGSLILLHFYNLVLHWTTWKADGKRLCGRNALEECRLQIVYSALKQKCQRPPPWPNPENAGTRLNSLLTHFLREFFCIEWFKANPGVCFPTCSRFAAQFAGLACSSVFNSAVEALTLPEDTRVHTSLISVFICLFVYYLVPPSNMSEGD